jgi:AhpD family alkylhydroperoxidase
MRTFANSTAVLESYLNFSGSLAGGLLSPQLREKIALVVAEANSCEYCLSAHTVISKMVGLSEFEITSSRQIYSNDAKEDAALKFAYQIVLKRGEVSDAEFRAIQDAGFSEGEIAEIITNVALNIFTNYFNHIAQTEVDFPKVSFSAKASN